MEFIKKSSQLVNVPDTLHSMFPGIARNHKGELVLECCGGSDFESSDAAMYYFKSSDNGISWDYRGELLDIASLKLPHYLTASCKPVQLNDNSMLSVGYGFLRDKPEMGLSDYAEKFGTFPKVLNFVSRSTDGGSSWSAPELIEHGYFGLEVSGPALQLANGEVLFFAPPFDLKAVEQLGLVMSSSDGGRTFKEKSRFFRSDDTTSWEVRSTQLASGRIVLIFWAFDLKLQQHRPNHIVWSDDNGATWCEPVDTGIPGQAANLVQIGDKLSAVWCKRAGDNTGIYLTELDLSGDTLTVGETACLWDAAGNANANGDITQQFAALKFGQPQAMMLDDKTLMLSFWAYAGEKYSIQIHHLQVK